MLLLPILLASVLDARGTRIKAQAQGRLRDALGLENVRIEEVSTGDGYADFFAFVDDREVGFLKVTRNRTLPGGWLAGKLAEDARTLFGEGFGGWVSTDEITVRHRFRGRGIGTRLYVAALAYAGRLGCALVSDNLYGGNKSEDAARAWTRLLLRFEGGWGDLPEVHERGFWAIYRPVAPERRPVVSRDGSLVGPGRRAFPWMK